MSIDDLKKRQKNNRLTLIGLLVVFASPMVIAYLAWWQGWFNNMGTTNHGELIKPLITLSQTGLQLQQRNIEPDNIKDHWWIIYVTDDEKCALRCQANAYLINQARTAQAKEMERVDRMLVSKNGKLTLSAEKFVKEHFLINNFATLADISPLKANTIYLMDPLGNIFMSYESVKDEKEAVIKGKGLVKDLKRLLKYSQIG